MISLVNNKWESSEVGDSLSKQLFTKTNAQLEKKNRDRKKRKQKLQSTNTGDKADPYKDQILSLKKNLKTIKQNSLNTKNDRARKSSKSPKKKSPDSKPQITTSKQFFKSLKKRSSMSKPDESHKSKESKISQAQNSHNFDKLDRSPKKKKPKSRKNGQDSISKNEERPRIERSQLSKDLKPQNKQEAKRKLLKLNLQDKTKINVTKLSHLLELKNNEPVMDQSQSLRERMVAQLKASRFRFLNEELYKNDSTTAKQMFKEDPEAFKAYHHGYQQQVNQWPVNPLDVIIAAVKKMPKDSIIADFGCGEARLAASVTQKVHSIDFVAVNDRVTACDMARTPLLIGGANVVVFCLSLMGTNLTDYLREANRVLKREGILKIAEVESRFDNIEEFISLLASFGFKNTWKDLSHNLFYFMDFKKIADVTTKNDKLPQLSLKPCLYKKR